MDKYFDFTETITLGVNETRHMEAILQAKPGILVIESIPNNAEFYLNGEYMGKTPLTLNNIEGGTYDYVMKYPHYEQWSSSLIIHPDETTSLEITMDKIFWYTGYFKGMIGVVGILLIIIIFYVYKKRKFAKKGEKVNKIEEEKQKLDEMLVKEIISQKEYDVAIKDLERK